MKIRAITLLLALALCVTIGGVYAVWTYAGTDDIADAFAEAKVTIADTELTGANGTYKIDLSGRKGGVIGGTVVT